MLNKTEWVEPMIAEWYAEIAVQEWDDLKALPDSTIILLANWMMTRIREADNLKMKFLYAHRHELYCEECTRRGIVYNALYKRD